jgi:hypothetical protein
MGKTRTAPPKYPLDARHAHVTERSFYVKQKPE